MALRAAHDLFTEAWRFYKRCVGYGLQDQPTPEDWAKAAADMNETYIRFLGTPMEALANRVLGLVYLSFEKPGECDAGDVLPGCGSWNCSNDANG